MLPAEARLPSTAREQIELWGAAREIAPEILERVFGDAPTDFPLRIRPRLPLLAHLNGAIAITLCRRVTVVAREWWCLGVNERCALLRHEAEHVKQQQDSPLLFYPRYILGWLAAWMTLPWGRGGWRRRGHRAYRSIPYEVAAYAVEERALAILRRACD